MHRTDTFLRSSIINCQKGGVLTSRRSIQVATLVADIEKVRVRIYIRRRI